MNVETIKSVPQVIDHWRYEDRSLRNSIEGFRKWLEEVEQRGIPHFGEAGARLSALKERLVQHFEHENLMFKHIGDVYLNPTPEIDGIRVRSLHDHDLLIYKLDDLYQRLTSLRPPFPTWQAAMFELNEFFERLEQHEEAEAEGFQLLSTMAVQHEHEME